MKENLRKVYRKTKRASFWKANTLTRFCYWLIQRCIGILLAIAHRVRHAKRIIMSLVYRIDFFARLRRNMNRKGIYLQLAKQARTNHQWERSKKYYEKLLLLVKNKPKQIELIGESRFHISILDRLLNLEQYQEDISKYNKTKQNSGKNRVAVVTAISGGYDYLKLPAVLNPTFDYIFFTDKPVRTSNIYQVRPLPYFHSDTTRMARYVKTNLHTLLPEYDVVIWIDANIMIVEDIQPMLDAFLKSRRAVGAIPHPVRSSVFEEADACIQFGKDDVELIKSQAGHLKEIGYDCNDLIESGFMMFNLKHNKIPQFFNKWWAEIDRYSRRDQLSLNYALDTAGIAWHHLMERPLDARNNPVFAYVPHHMNQQVVYDLEKALGSPSIDPYDMPSFITSKDAVVASQHNQSIDIVYCVHNALEDVKRCLASVVKNRSNKKLSLIIIDDGSDEPTAKFLKTFTSKHSTWVSLNRSETGSGYTKAANRGLRLSTADFVILLNSDTIVTDSWSEKMMHAVLSTPGAGIVGPISSAASHQSIPDHHSKNNQTSINELPHKLTPEDMNKLCEKQAMLGWYPLVPLVHGFCFGITRATINKIGYFDEKLFPNGYGEENDYCFRATAAGIRLVLATNTYIYHAKSRSYQSEERIGYMKRGNQTIKEHHGADRVRRDVITMENNPLLVSLRQKASELYKQAV